MNNTVVRTLSGIVFIGVMVGAILLSRYTFIALTTIIVTLGIWEFYRLTIPNAGYVQKVLGIICGIVVNTLPFVLLYIPSYVDLNILAIVFSLLAVFISSLYSKLEKPFEVISYVIAAVVYIALPFSLMSLWNGSLLISDFNSGSNQLIYCGLPILSYFIILWANDVGAYCFGITLGRLGNHKLFPRHSPKKTWEGFVGGMLMSMLAGYLVCILLLDGQHRLQWVGLGLIVSVFATFGDLVESMLKRSVGVKDSGKIMPGHGGILDRFDGVLLSFIPVFIYSDIVFNI